MLKRLLTNVFAWFLFRRLKTSSVFFHFLETSFWVTILLWSLPVFAFFGFEIWRGSKRTSKADWPLKKCMLYKITEEPDWILEILENSHFVLSVLFKWLCHLLMYKEGNLDVHFFLNLFLKTFSNKKNIASLKRKQGKISFLPF